MTWNVPESEYAKNASPAVELTATYGKSFKLAFVYSGLLGRLIVLTCLFE